VLDIGRREFITLLGGAAVAWPLAARAQQPAIPVVGFLSSASAAPFERFVAGFKDGLKSTGHIVGQNVAIEYRWADGQYDRLPALAAELVRLQVAAITVGGAPTIIAAMAATKTIPIVFSSGGDPVKLGFVASLNRPGGNVTGINIFVAEIEGKRLGLLRELVPGAVSLAVLLNPNNPNAEGQSRGVQQAARVMGLQTQTLYARSEGEIDTAFATMAQQRAEALLVGSDPFFNSRRDLVVALTARHRIPAMYELREFALAGGLMSYGTNLVDGYRQVGIYTGRILKGEKPSDLPVLQATKFEFVINIKTAKALGVKISDNLLSIADEVIE
jgi:putative tryptophan/tyrosine transport system substrate-binding protein